MSAPTVVHCPLAFLPSTPLSVIRTLSIKKPSCSTTLVCQAVPDHNPIQPSRRNFLHGAAAALALTLTNGLPLPASSAIEQSTPRDLLYDAASNRFVPPSALPTVLQQATGRLFDRCVIAAEIHNSPGSHMAQLASLESVLSLSDRRSVIVGCEMFYRQHTPVLDKYINGQIALDEMLESTNWDSIWGFDSALYTPLFEFCREHRIRLLGLNAPSQLVWRVAQLGVQGLSDSEREALPKQMDFSNNAHFQHFRDAIQTSLSAHGSSQDDDGIIARLYQVQVLWEEWMSESVAQALAFMPDSRLVALVGAGHVEGRFGFPDRIERRCNERPYTIVPRDIDWAQANADDLPDFSRPESAEADLLWYTPIARNKV